MEIREAFLKRIEEEYDDFCDKNAKCKSAEIIARVNEIAKFNSMYEYLQKVDKFSDKQIEELVRLENPINHLCNLVESGEGDIRIKFNKAVAMVTDKDFFFGNAEQRKEWLLNLMREELKAEQASRHNSDTSETLFNVVEKNAHRITEEMVSVLGQFDKPLSAICAATKCYYYPVDVVERAVKFYNGGGLYLYEDMLNPERTYPETKYRIDALCEIRRNVHGARVNITMQWIDFYKNVIDDGEGGNPYKKLLEAFKQIEDEHGSAVLQTIYKMGQEQPLPSSELIEAAKYIADVGKYNNLHMWASKGKFQRPYEEVKSEIKEYHFRQETERNLRVEFRYYDQTAIAKWLAMYREANSGLIENEENPYAEFMGAVLMIKSNYDGEMVKNILDINLDECGYITPSELLAVAEYIHDGGNLAKIPQLIDDDYFTSLQENEQEQCGIAMC